VNPYLHWTFLIAFTALWLPFAIAQSIGWTPPWLCGRHGPVRLLGAAGLVLYAVVLVNTVPRLARATPDTLAYASYTGSALALVFSGLLITYAVKARSAPCSGR
jgi:hypothetical protein